jgi:hypothetical protein
MPHDRIQLPRLSQVRRLVRLVRHHHPRVRANHEYGIGVYGLEKNRMINGEPARAVSFFINGNHPTLLPLVGDGLLPADIDGMTRPANTAAIPLVGTQDDNYVYGATSDALNILGSLGEVAQHSGCVVNIRGPTPGRRIRLQLPHWIALVGGGLLSLATAPAWIRQRPCGDVQPARRGRRRPVRFARRVDLGCSPWQRFELRPAPLRAR